MRCIRQELKPFKLASNGREAFDVSKFLPISGNFQVQLLIDVLDHNGSYMTSFFFFFFFFEDVEKKMGLKSPKLHTPR